MGYWKSKVLPRIKKVFEKNPKKAAAAEATKAFDGSKEEIDKELEEKKILLQPRVVEIYEASAAEVKTIVKERKVSGLRKNAAAVQKLLDELVKIDFPGSKRVSEASAEYGPALVSGPVFFMLEKVSSFIVEPSKEQEVAVAEEKREEGVPYEEIKKKEEVSGATAPVDVEEEGAAARA